MASRAWAARNARAQALGYRNYYDYRVHGYGSSPAAAPPASGETLARLRGHRSDADLRQYLEREPELVLVSTTKVERDPATGQITSMEIELLDDQGRSRTFTVHKLDDPEERDRLATLIGGTGATLSKYVSRILTELAAEEEYAGEPGELEAYMDELGLYDEGEEVA